MCDSNAALSLPTCHMLWLSMCPDLPAQVPQRMGKGMHGPPTASSSCSLLAPGWCALIDCLQEAGFAVVGAGVPHTLA